jgi:hypothetical protein
MKLRWPLIAAAVIASLAALGAIKIARFVLTCGESEEETLSATPTSLTAEWKALRPMTLQVCSRSESSLLLTFPEGEGNIEVAERSRPEAVAVDESGKEHRLAPGSRIYSTRLHELPLSSFELVGLKVNEIRIRASDKIHVPTIVWRCRDDCF